MMTTKTLTPVRWQGRDYITVDDAAWFLDQPRNTVLNCIFLEHIEACQVDGEVLVDLKSAKVYQQRLPRIGKANVIKTTRRDDDQSDHPLLKGVLKLVSG